MEDLASEGKYHLANIADLKEGSMQHYAALCKALGMGLYVVVGYGPDLGR